MPSRRVRALLLAAIALPTAAAAEEGMWTFDNFPIPAANAALDTRIDQAWLDRVRLASVRLGGASGGLVSGEGLILTNEHVASRCVEDLSTPERNFVASGFTPASRSEERRCPGMVAEILTDISDVTDRVQAAGRGLEGEAFTRARDAEISRIESEACGGDSSRRCQVVPLYRGGQFKLYAYRRYADVRLAFAPEHRASAFGGDLDNFSFPRFAVDAAFVRIYENDRPAATPVHFRWNPAPPREGEPVLLSGSPGATQRLLTQDQLRTVADLILPLEQLLNSELRGRLIQFGAASEQNAFIAGQALSSVENGYKRGYGRQQALVDRAFMERRAAAEADFRRRVAADPALARDIGDPWAELAEVQDEVRRLHPAYYLLEIRAGGGSRLFGWAEDLVRGAQEREKPNAERLPEYGDARLPQVETSLLAERPAYPALDEVQLAWWLSKLREILTVDDPRVRAVLGEESPEALARRLAHNTRLGDLAFRRSLWEGGLAAVSASDDPLIRFLLRIQEVTRSTRSEYEARVEAPTERAGEKLARARFAVYGTSLYPDATGTLRLTYGRIEGWTHQGRTIPHATTFAGLWDRATGAPPFDLAPRLAAARDRIPAETVLDVAASTDTIGGSSGSPAVNAAGEIIGANFDSTVLTQRNAYGYDPAVNRSVLVTTAAITAALRHAYSMDHLLEELRVVER
ncbi:S46 family peptidase [Sphingosinicella terrae]|uniref:S46 family peptidase n=1 Tax=Sphingosinicella terrae TaxID=2172047 RepID=UPI000E0D7FA4|nr:S46 family peptidase [Sphingosinicella terrae]